MVRKACCGNLNLISSLTRTQGSRGSGGGPVAALSLMGPCPVSTLGPELSAQPGDSVDLKAQGLGFRV